MVGHIWAACSQAGQGQSEVTQEVPRQPELHNETLSQKKKIITLYPKISTMTHRYAIKIIKKKINHKQQMEERKAHP